METLTKAQQIQEEEYDFPYHWTKVDYDKGGRLYFGYLRLAIAQSAQIKKATSNLKILDAGCGDARLVKEIGEYGDFDLYGSDYSERAVAFGKLLLPNATFSAEDLTERTSFADNTFDVVFLVETLEHIIPEKVDSLLKEIKRILKPGGEFIVTVPSDALPPGPKHYQHFSAKKLESFLNPYFVNVKVVGQDKMGFSLWKVFYQLVDNKVYQFKRLTKWYNRKIWPMYFNKCDNASGRRVISVANKVKV